MDFREIEQVIKGSAFLSYADVEKIPLTSGVYCAWLKDSAFCIYVGSSKNRRERIQSHFSGQRGSDQFCLYVYDNYVHNQRCQVSNTAITREVNAMTARWIQDNVSFRCIELPAQEIRDAEGYLSGTLNPILPVKSSSQQGY